MEMEKDGRQRDIAAHTGAILRLLFNYAITKLLDYPIL